MTEQLLERQTIDPALLVPNERTLQCVIGRPIDLNAILKLYDRLLHSRIDLGFTDVRTSYCFVMMMPMTNRQFEALKTSEDRVRPDILGWFRHQWNASDTRHVADCLELLETLTRPVGSTGSGQKFDAQSTYHLTYVAPEHFPGSEGQPKEVIETSRRDLRGSGAVRLQFDDLVVVGAIQGLRHIDSHLVAADILGIIAKRIMDGGGLR